MKKLIIIAFLLAFISSFSQVVTTKIVKVANNTTLFNENLIKDIEILDYATKRIYLTLKAIPATKSISTCIMDVDLKELQSNLIKAKNGLYIVSGDLRDTIKLGGSLTEPTTITQNGKIFKILESGKGEVFDQNGIAYTKIDTAQFSDSTLITKLYAKKYKLKSDSVKLSGYFTNYKATFKKDKADSIANSGYATNYKLHLLANEDITSLAFSGTTTKTITLTKQDGSTVTTTFTDLDNQTLSSSASGSTRTITISGGNSTSFNVDGGNATSVVNSITFNNSGTGDVSGIIFNGSAAKTVSYNTVGAAPASGSGNYIWNQDSAAQSAKFWISGNSGINSQPNGFVGLNVSGYHGIVGQANNSGGWGGIFVSQDGLSEVDLGTNGRAMQVKGDCTVEGTIQISKLSGTNTRLVSATSDGTLTNVANGTGFFKNDGSGNWSYDNSTYSLSTHNHEISSLLTTGISANQVPISNGSNGINFSALKTINGNSIFGSGNLTLGGGNVSNTGTPVASQIPIWTNATTIKGTTNLTWMDYTTSHALQIESPSPSLFLKDSDYASPISRGYITYDGGSAALTMSAFHANVSYDIANFNKGGINFYTIPNRTTSNVLYYNQYDNSISWGTAPGGGGGFSDPMTSIGDIIYRNGSNITSRLGIGSSGQILTVVGGLPSWQNAPSGTSQWAGDSYGIYYSSNVGIGTNSGQYNKLKLANNVADNPTLYISNSNTSGHGIWVYAGNSVSQSGLYVGNYNGSKTLLDIRSDGQVWIPNIPSATTSNVLYFNSSTGAITYGAAGSGGGGSGTVTSFSSGSLSPLFTTSVANSTTTPALSFSAVAQAQNLVYASPNGSSGTPTFRKIVVGDISASGAPSSSTYLRGDGSWGTPAGATNYWTYSAPKLYPNNDSDNLIIGKSSSTYVRKFQVYGDSYFENHGNTNETLWSEGDGTAGYFRTNRTTGTAVVAQAYNTVSGVSTSVLSLTGKNWDTTGTGVGMEFSDGSPKGFINMYKSSSIGANFEVKLYSFPVSGIATKMTLEGDTGNLTIDGSIKVGDGYTSVAASSSNVGSIRYRTSGNNSYCEMSMQTGASTYSWVIIKQNSW